MTRPVPGESERDAARDIDGVVERLTSRYGVPGWEVRRHAEMIYASYREAPIRAFVPILVEKGLRDWLRHRRAGAE